jgi:adenosylcobinamide-phosphate synthase
LYADTWFAGGTFAASAVLPLCTAALALDRSARRRPLLRAVLVAAATWTVIGGHGLRDIGTQMANLLDDSDTTGGRALVPSLCGRDPASLDYAGLARATVESIAENTSDSVVAPLFWGAVAGLPGLFGYRAINTLDAMVGHRSARYARFGTVSARLDDVANLLPARLAAALTLAGAKRVDGSARQGWAAWRSGAHLHPSPNAGQCEAAMAGVLGVELGGPTSYRGMIENRPALGFGRPPTATDIRRAVRVSRFIQSSAVGVLVASVALSSVAQVARSSALIRLKGKRS